MLQALRQRFPLAIVTDAQTAYAHCELHKGADRLFRPDHRSGEPGFRLFDSDEGTKHYEDCAPDYRITDHRELLQIMGIGH
jgi:putative hydrolase of the HAD superfamily